MEKFKKTIISGKNRTVHCRRTRPVQGSGHSAWVGRRPQQDGHERHQNHGSCLSGDFGEFLDFLNIFQPGYEPIAELFRQYPEQPQHSHSQFITARQFSVQTATATASTSTNVQKAGVKRQRGGLKRSAPTPAIQMAGGEVKMEKKYFKLKFNLIFLIFWRICSWIEYSRIFF